MAHRPPIEPVADILLEFRDRDGADFLRIATTRGEATAEEIIRRLRQYVRLGVELSYSVAPCRFTTIRPRRRLAPTTGSPTANRSTAR